MNESKADALECLIAGMASQRAVINVQAMMDALEHPSPCRVGLVGEFNSGKSSLVNAFLGRRLLPAMNVPTTCSITEVEVDSTARAPRYFGLTETGEVEISAADFGEVATGGRAGTLLLRAPATACFLPGLRLVDTPGLQSLARADADFTFGYLPLLDGIMFCHDVTKGDLAASELAFLGRPEVGALMGGMLVVLTRCDLSSASDLADQRAAVAEQVAALGLSEDRVVTTAAELVLRTDPPEFDSISDLSRTFDERFVKGQTAMRRARRARGVLEAGRTLLKALQALRTTSTLDDSELRVREASIAAEIARLQGVELAEEGRLNEWESELRLALVGAALPYAAAFASAGGEAELDVVGRQLVASLTAEVRGRTQQYGAGLLVAIGGHEIGGLVGELKALATRVDAGVTVITALVVAVASGGTSVAANAGEAAIGATVKTVGDVAQKAGAVGRAANAIAAIGRVIKAINPVEYGGLAVKHALGQRAAAQALPAIAQQVASTAKAQVLAHVQREVFGPLQRDLDNQQLALRQITAERMNQVHRTQRDRAALDADIAELLGALPGEPS